MSVDELYCCLCSHPQLLLMSKYSVNLRFHLRSHALLLTDPNICVLSRDSMNYSEDHYFLNAQLIDRAVCEELPASPTSRRTSRVLQPMVLITSVAISLKGEPQRWTLDFKGPGLPSPPT